MRSVRRYLARASRAARHLAHRLDELGGGWNFVWAVPLLGLAWLAYLALRWLEGARQVETTFPRPPMPWEIQAEGVDVSWDGGAPVEGWGTVDGRPCYYRSRGEGWEFRVAKPGGDVFGSDAWAYFEKPYFWPYGGWVANSVSEACIRRAVAVWRSVEGLRAPRILADASWEVRGRLSWQRGFGLRQVVEVTARSERDAYAKARPLLSGSPSFDECAIRRLP